MAVEKEIKKEEESKSPGSTDGDKSTITSPATSELKPATPAIDMVEDRKSADRDIALANVEQDKRLSFIKAWEESEKTKALNKAEKKISALEAWEKSKKASIDAKLKAIQEVLENQVAKKVEKMKNAEALVHKKAEEKRAMVQANKGEHVLMIEEKAAKYRASGYTPKKFFCCVSF